MEILKDFVPVLSTTVPFTNIKVVEIGGYESIDHGIILNKYDEINLDNHSMTDGCRLHRSHRFYR
ncbi:MAG: hypothetical protein ACN6ON_12815 [Sphingobacterium sp.]